MARRKRVTVRDGIAAVLLLGATGVANAHPHVLVDARAEVVFGESGQLTAIRHIWQFDEAFTAYAVQGLDEDGDNQLSDTELQPLAKVNVDSLAEFGFFTFLTINGSEAGFAPPNEYWLEFHGGRLTLFFTLPLTTPLAPGAETLLEVYDPELFVGFTFVETEPVKLAGSFGVCAATFTPPAAIDEATLMTLAEIPSDGTVPPELAAITQGLSNRIEIACPN